MNPDPPRSRLGTVLPDRPVGEPEARLRHELTTAFRVGRQMRWNFDTRNHMTARIPGTGTFLMNPLGLAWDEITPVSLATVDFDGKVLSHTGLQVPSIGFRIHSAILKARPEVQSVIHTHAPAGVVIGALEEGLTILSQNGCRLHGEVGYHDFEGIVSEDAEVPRLVADLGSRHALILRNHGLLTVGASIGEAFGYMRTLVDECEILERALATGRPLRPIPEELQIRVKAQTPGQGGTDPSWGYWMRLSERLGGRPSRT